VETFLRHNVGQGLEKLEPEHDRCNWTYCHAAFVGGNHVYREYSYELL